MEKINIICIGASAGGITAIQMLFSELHHPPSCPVVIAQHLPADAEWDLQLVFGRFLKGEIFEVRDKMPLEAGKFYFAPGGYHVLVEREGYLALSQDELVHHSRPSIDVLFEAAAWAFGAHACGIVLTGANADGTEGLKAIGHAGGFTIVQDPEEAESPMMPRSALERANPKKVMHLKAIAAWIDELRGEA